MEPFDLLIFASLSGAHYLYQNKKERKNTKKSSKEIRSLMRLF